MNSGFFKGAMDWHCHLLPGVDDGSPTITESLNMIKALKSLGFRGAYCTPHIMARYPENTPLLLKERFEEIHSYVDKEDFELHLAAEYMLDEQFLEKFNKEMPLTYDGTHILIEFSQMALPPNWQEMLFQIKSCGFIPVLAHPERYWHLISKVQDRELLLDGCKFQLDLFSLSEYYGKKISHCATYFIAENLYSYIGSDSHSSRQIRNLSYLMVKKSIIKNLKFNFSSHSLSLTQP